MADSELAPGAGLAPGVPADYYERIFEVERTHWWHLGMRAVAAALLRDRLGRPGQRVLDAGCGTGGVLEWLGTIGSFGRMTGVDISSTAIELARRRVPRAVLHVAPLDALPVETGSCDLVVCNDVLQHVPAPDEDGSLRELGRVLAPGGTLLLRTNGARRIVTEREDWRRYDAVTLRGALERAGLQVSVATYANVLPSLAAALQGHIPHAPHDGQHAQHGIPEPTGSRKAAVGLGYLRAEAWWLGRGGRLPFGHTLFVRADGA